MTRIGIFVGEGNWMFFREIYDDLAIHYPTEVFKERTYNIPLLYGRVNRWAYHKGINDMLRQNDVCFFEWASELLVTASWLPKSCAIVVRLHSFELYTWAPKINWHAIDKIILVSEAMRNRFCELYPEHADKTEVIRNGVSIKIFKPIPHEGTGLNLGTICRISPVKRVYELVLMAYEMRQQGHKVNLHIAGEPHGDLRYAVAIESLIEKLDLHDSVHLYGHVADVHSWLHKIDIFISNSYWESQHVALVEAMATGCFCLAHFWDGADEVLPAEYLFGTESELQEKLVIYWNLSSEEQEARQTELQSIVQKKFDIERQKPKIRRIIDEAIAMKSISSEPLVKLNSEEKLSRKLR